MVFSLVDLIKCEFFAPGMIEGRGRAKKARQPRELRGSDDFLARRGAAVRGGFSRGVLEIYRVALLYTPRRSEQDEARKEYIV